MVLNMALHFRILPPKRTLILFAVLFLPFLADAVWKWWKDYRWRQTPALSLNSLGYLYYPKELSIRPADSPFSSKDMIRISAVTSLGYNSILEYNKDSGQIQFRVFHVSSSFFFPEKIQSCFRISNPAQEEEVRRIILGHEKELTDSDFQRTIRDFLARHKIELSNIGDGNFRLGLARAGVADWIKAGKDPEAEWARKFSPAGTADSGEFEQK